MPVNVSHSKSMGKNANLEWTVLKNMMQNFKFPWQILRFPNIYLTMNFPDFFVSVATLITVLFPAFKVKGPFVETPHIFLCMQNINYTEILACKDDYYLKIISNRELTFVPA